MDRVLEVRDLYKKYGGEAVLTGVSFDVPRGQTHVVMGPSGTGKSTLLRCVNRLTEPDGGRIRLDGVEIADARANINKARADIGYVFQDFNLFTHLSARANVRIGLVQVRRLDKRRADERARAMLERVGLKDKADAYPAELSGGQQQRVAIARALAMQPKVMFFDEPTSALDPELTGEVLQVMDELAREGMTMLVVSHELGFARRAASEILFMEGGGILEQGPPERLFNEPQQARTGEFLRRIAAEG
jgi:polar amino acid transport system ATP-binding protein